MKSVVCAMMMLAAMGVAGGSGVAEAQGIDAGAQEGTFQQVSDGLNYTCEVKTDGTAVCWWVSDYQGGTFQQVSAGLGHTCGVKTDGAVVCWGWNEYGQFTPHQAPPGVFQQVSIWRCLHLWGEDGRRGGLLVERMTFLTLINSRHQTHRRIRRRASFSKSALAMLSHLWGEDGRRGGLLVELLTGGTMTFLTLINSRHQTHCWVRRRASFSRSALAGFTPVG